MIEPSILRILNSKGQTIGTGFLVSKTLAVTCAHVAMAAAPDGENRIRAQFTGQKQPIIFATVLDEFLDLDRDVALLELESVPADVQPLRLGSAAQCQPGNPFYSFGYTSAAKVQGIIARGAIDGYLPQHQLLQLQAPQANHGISGAPVLDEKRGVVVGMITKGHKELGRNQETTFATPAELFFAICPAIRPSETCPYLGLESFSAETERFFFGRTALTEKLLTTLSRGCRFLAVFGPSGSGKSSVVQAGLLPALKKSQTWAQIIIRPAEDPFAQLSAAGLDLSNLPSTKTILFIDQFEELFTCSDETRERFVRELAAALDNSYLILIIAMRDDFYSAFNAKAAPLAGWAYEKVDVPATLNRSDLVAMIEQPAAAVGLSLEEGLTDAIIKDTTTDGAARSSTLPLLEFALTQLWDKRRDGLLTHNAYKAIRGVAGSLALWADEAYSDLSKAEQPLAESLLTALVRLGDESQGLPDTRRRRTLSECDEPTRRVIKHFADRRLLVTGGETVELVHDALVREWGRLQGWIKQDRENLRLMGAVSDAAREWEAGNRDESLLNHRGARLELALVASKNPYYVLSHVAMMYLDSCVAIIDREKRTAWLRLIGVATIVVSALITIVLVVTLAITGQFGRLIYQPLPMEWVKIPASKFLMGSSNKEIADALAICPSCDIVNEQPQHLVYLDAYQIGRYEVTNKQYYQCIQAGVCNRPTNSEYIKSEFQNYPVTDITWKDALIFCEWNGGRLPTEAEWEKAARGAVIDVKKTRIYPWGNQWDTQKAYVDQGKNAKAMPVGSYSPIGDSVYGVADMSGNVWEWVMDWYGKDYYAASPAQNPTGPDSGKYRVLHGGSFANSSIDARSTYRAYNYIGNVSNDVGLRCAK